MLTAYRRENIGKLMHNMFIAFCRIVYENSKDKVIYPIHMNPVVKKLK